ncbi:Cytochrome c oxidase subunit 6A, mitochondrial [Lachnellula subtilissima]|uniref:Cytochrome c oxidase subunit 6A, mitochondrial n=1 Tax=Lachnellula subtilissima TaxID=602034 RepID=A0A8H8RZV6_9HELO|nr:Cytochrome c oxidase subunit 6A, mitochondrial [Lachnellula subtilissima]
MFPQRTMLRSMRSPALGRTIQRRLASTESKFTGAEDNAFNRERQAVKDHAAATSVTTRNGEGVWEVGRREGLTLRLCSAVIPALLISGANAYNLWTEHWAHWEHLPPLEERTEYEYQNIRARNFCWGDGDKTFFWNDGVNYHKKE